MPKWRQQHNEEHSSRSAERSACDCPVAAGEQRLSGRTTRARPIGGRLSGGMCAPDMRVIRIESTFHGIHINILQDPQLRQQLLGDLKKSGDLRHLTGNGKSPMYGNLQEAIMDTKRQYEAIDRALEVRTERVHLCVLY